MIEDLIVALATQVQFVLLIQWALLAWLCSALLARLATPLGWRASFGMSAVGILLGVPVPLGFCFLISPLFIAESALALATLTPWERVRALVPTQVVGVVLLFFPLHYAAARSFALPKKKALVWATLSVTTYAAVSIAETSLLARLVQKAAFSLVGK
jgi:hypothetical protein